MHCEHCLESIREAARKLDGVEEVTGDPARQVVTVTYCQGMVEPDGIRGAIIERGFQVIPIAAPKTINKRLFGPVFTSDIWFLTQQLV